MRHRLATLLAAAVILGAGALPAPAGSSTAIVAKKCHAGYVHARIGGKEKCLHSGEVCSQRYANDYKRYGFKCVGGRLHRRKVGSGY
jgi:uncharacterized membrane protein